MLSTEVAQVGTDITTVPTKTTTYVTINSRPYILESKCRLCKDLPETILISLTLDLLLYHKSKQTIIREYNKYLKPSEPSINYYNIDVHLKHSNISMLSDTDKKALLLHSDKMEMLQKIIQENGEEFNLDNASIQLIKETHESFVTLGTILQRQERELIELESGKLPDIMKDTYQIKDPTTKELVTANLYPLIEKKRKDVLKTTEQYMNAKMELQRLMRDTLKVGGDQSVVIAVNQIFHNLNAIQLGLQKYLDIIGQQLKDMNVDDIIINKFARVSIDFFQKNILNESYKIESIIRDMLQKK